MKKNMLIVFCTVSAMLPNLSCKKETNTSNIKAVFSYVADGFKVNFTDYSSNAKEYKWDFGDNDTSNAANPIHVYHSKGDFLTTLTIRNGQETSTFTDTVFISGPNIKIDDDFSDWTYVEYSSVNEGGSGGSLLGVKTFASGGSLNFYIEGTEDLNFAIMDIYLDTDNDPATGFQNSSYPVGSGADYLLEGSVPGEWGDVFIHTGPDNGDWSWDPISDFASTIKFSAIKDADGKKAIEFSIKRDGLGVLKNYVNFAIQESTEGYSVIGSVPVPDLETSAFGQIKL
ncbi:MAG TPA: PKD domain-containing protein [Flavitalea sp.]|nr:PKD domain-containing protein [Flavitalea sp.]